MALNLTITIAEFLQNNPEQKFIAREIAEQIYEHYLDRCWQKQQKSKTTAIPLDNDQVLFNKQLENSDQRDRLYKKKYPKIKITEERPRKYYFTESTDSAEIDKSGSYR